MNFDVGSALAPAVIYLKALATQWRVGIAYAVVGFLLGAVL